MAQIPGPPPPQGPPPPGPPPGGYYPPPPQGAPPQARPTNVLAIVGLVCSFLFFPAGLICGIIARKQIKQTGEDGAGLALAAIIISSVQVVLSILSLIFIVIFFVVLARTGTDIINNLPSPSPFPSPFPTS